MRPTKFRHERKKQAQQAQREIQEYFRAMEEMNGTAEDQNEMGPPMDYYGYGGE